MASRPVPFHPVPFVLLAGSAALLLGALAFQYIGGLRPCVLCIWQRWPHGIVIALAAIALLPGPGPATRRVLVGLAGVALLVGAGIALYHVGVEQKIFAGTESCVGGSISSATSLAEARERLLNAPVVRCDEVAWSMFGISMAGYNALISLMLAAFAGTTVIRQDLWQVRP
ncbi:MAG: disulfide bond formation protein B [Alphaproteobacteria bacterium]